MEDALTIYCPDSYWTRWTRCGHRARWTRWTRWGCRTRGCRTRKAWPFATPVGHIFRVLIERWRATLPRREVAAGVEQIAGDVDLLAFLGVGQTLHRRLGMSLDGDDDRHRQRDEHPHNTAIDHEHSFMQSLLSGLNCSDGPAGEGESPFEQRNPSPEITGDDCNCGQIVGNIWARRTDQHGYRSIGRSWHRLGPRIDDPAKSMSPSAGCDSGRRRPRWPRPCRASGLVRGSFADSLWHRNWVLAEAALEHTFVQGIASGELAQATFVYYVGQDAAFLWGDNGDRST